MPKMPIQQDSWQKEVPRHIRAESVLWPRKASHDYEQGLPFLPIRYASNNYSQLGQTADVVAIFAAKRQQDVNACVNSQNLQARFHFPRAKKPGKRDFHSLF